ncbi:unnamed protein product [Calypogeia fissa]
MGYVQQVLNYFHSRLAPVFFDSTVGMPYLELLSYPARGLSDCNLRLPFFLVLVRIKNMQELSWNRRLTAVPEEWHRVSYKENVRGEVLLSFNFIPMTPAELLASETPTLVMGDASPDNHGNRNSDENSGDAWNLAQFVVCGAVKIGTSAML